MSFLLVGIGGAIGALLRYEVTRLISGRFILSFPVATLFINVTGAFLLGWFTRSMAIWLPQAHTFVMLLLGVGMCGAYTTFSTFSYEVVILARERRVSAAATYVLASFLFGLAAAGLGLYGM